MTYTVYKHTNKLTGKSYIGITKHSTEVRWKGHVQLAKSDSTKVSHFLRSLRKYGTSDDVWEHTTLVTGVPDYARQPFEKYYIHKYNTFNNGYNSTIGGDYFAGYVQLKGEDNSNYIDFHIEVFHIDGKSFSGKVSKFMLLHGGDKSQLQSLKTGKVLTHLGWRTTPTGVIDTRYMHKKFSIATGDLPEIPTVAIGNDKGKFTPLERLIWRDSLSRKFSGKNNPIYGSTRPQNVKDAVSRRRRNDADKTLRTWVHDDKTVEEGVTCLELRDKYPYLRIGQLNAIALKLTNKRGYRIGVSTKGWRLK